jgi:hypothetical protein
LSPYERKRLRNIRENANFFASLQLAEVCMKFVMKVKVMGWRDGSAGKNTDCSSEGPKFKSQQPHGGLLQCTYV